MLRGAASVVLRNGAICANIAVFAGFYGVGWRFIQQPLDHRNRRTLAIRNLTAAGAKRILTSRGAEADIVSVTDEQPTTEPPRPKPPPRRLGLSGKLLLLTIPLVMIA